MIAVLQAPRIEEILQDGKTTPWDLVLWIGKPFDRATPFRQILGQIIGTLVKGTPCDLRRPAYKVDEDFVAGTMSWDGHEFEVYYENSLGYLSFTSTQRRAIERLTQELLPILRISDCTSRCQCANRSRIQYP